jgi:hypothetical protein
MEWEMKGGILVPKAVPSPICMFIDEAYLLGQTGFLQAAVPIPQDIYTQELVPQCKRRNGAMQDSLSNRSVVPFRCRAEIPATSSGGRKGREVVRADAGILKAALEELSLLESALLATVAPRWDDSPLGGSPAPTPIPSLPPGLTPQYVSGARQSVLVILASREHPEWTPALQALPRRPGHRSCLRLSPGH